MTLCKKLVFGLAALILMIGLVGGGGLLACKHLLQTFEGGEKKFRAIATSATAASGLAKQIESHMLAYLLFGQESALVQLREAEQQLRGQLRSIDRDARLSEARDLIQKMLSLERELAATCRALMALRQQEIKLKGEFRLNGHTEAVRQLNDVAATLRKLGLQLTDLETGFLNHQETISAASKITSFVKRGEGHLLLYLTLGDPTDRGKFYARIASLNDHLQELHRQENIPGIGELLADIEQQSALFKARGEELLARFDRESGSRQPFRTDRHQSEIEAFQATAEAIRLPAQTIMRIAVDHEQEQKQLRFDHANQISLVILLLLLLTMSFAIIMSVALYRSLSRPLARLRHAAAEVGRGRLETRIQVERPDEIGMLSATFNTMAANLQKTLVTKNHLENILNSLSDTLLVLGPDLQILQANLAAGTLLGSAPEKLCGVSLKTLCRDEVVSGALSQLLSQKKLWCCRETMIHTLAGARITALFSAARLPGENGLPDGLVCSVRDISGLKKSETEMMHLQQQLANAKKMETIGTLAGGIAHEFNNMLTPIIGFTEMAVEKLPADHDASSFLENVLKAAYRTKGIIHQLLTFSRRDVREKHPLCLVQTMREAVELLRITIPEHLTINLDTSLDEAWVLANTSQVHQLVMNLGGNAYHAMKDSGGTFQIQLQEKTDFENTWRLIFRDCGLGMNEATLGRIFEPFFTTRDPGEGTGLGLSVVHGIVRDLGGSIEVKSSPDQGTSVIIDLPAANPEAAPCQVSLPIRMGGNEHLVLVEDDRVILNLVWEALRQQGYRVAGFHVATEALAYLRHSPDECQLLITDFAMPDMTGVELIRSLRANDRQTPVLMITGFDGSLEPGIMEQLGIADLMLKPVVLEELYLRVRWILDRDRSAEEGNTGTSQ